MGSVLEFSVLNIFWKRELSQSVVERRNGPVTILADGMSARSVS